MPAPKFIKKGKRSSDRRMRADINRSQMSMSSFGKDQMWSLVTYHKLVITTRPKTWTSPHRKLFWRDGHGQGVQVTAPERGEVAVEPVQVSRSSQGVQITAPERGEVAVEPMQVSRSSQQKHSQPRHQYQPNRGDNSYTSTITTIFRTNAPQLVFRHQRVTCRCIQWLIRRSAASQFSQ